VCVCVWRWNSSPTPQGEASQKHKVESVAIGIFFTMSRAEAPLEHFHCRACYAIRQGLPAAMR
jgi:hypothetical protein